MAEVINKNQQVFVAGTRPRAHYSRVVSLQVIVPVYPGQAYQVTPPLGNNLWILEVKIWLKPKAVNVANGTCIRVKIGGGGEAGFLQIATWDDLLPVVVAAGGTSEWYLWDGFDKITWDMSVFVTGESRRIGILAARVGAGTDVIQASFRISEG